MEGEDVKFPAVLWTEDNEAPRVVDVLSQIGHFFDQLGYTTTFTALLKEAQDHGVKIDIAGWEDGIGQKTSVPLLDLWADHFDEHEQYPSLPPSSPTSASSSDESESDSESSAPSDSSSDAGEGALRRASDESDESDDSDDSDSDEEEVTVATITTKRKRAHTPSSEDESDDDSSSGSSSGSDEGDVPPAKKTKIIDAETSSDGDDTSDASSSDEDDDLEQAETEDTTDQSSSDDSSDDSSSDDNDGSEEERATPTVARSVNVKRKRGLKDEPAPSDSSATLEGDGPVEDSSSQVHPDRQNRFPGSKAAAPSTKKEAAADRKKQAVPFSRIPADQSVDPRFASNAYVSYDYADRAHRDLIVTKGKGFTKEKNKKKRGAYRGGLIDMTPKGIKFDD